MDILASFTDKTSPHTATLSPHPSQKVSFPCAELHPKSFVSNFWGAVHFFIHLQITEKNLWKKDIYIYIHIYTGNGKGKTTAAFGLAARAICAGKNVAVCQFVKSMKYSETGLLQLLSNAPASFGKLRIEQCGHGCCLIREPGKADIDCALSGLDKCTEWMRSGEWDVVVLDEITIAIHLGLISTEQVINAINSKAPSTEIVITGRYAPSELIGIADLVTDMQEVKHYYSAGVLSRKGIDV